jgi:hypothetical protein
MDKQKKPSDGAADAKKQEPISQGGPLGVSHDKDESDAEGALSTTRSAPPQGPSS